MSDEPAETLWKGRWLAAKRRGKWEFVSRVGGIEAAVILALDGDAVILVEQWRAPLDGWCLELPAGLIGDEKAGESTEESARRELEEETGYRADRIEPLGKFYSSPGMAAEGFTLVRATGLTRIGDGGGTSDERIVVRRVPLANIADFVSERRHAGVAMDVKLLLLLGPTLFATAEQHCDPVDGESA